MAFKTVKKQPEFTPVFGEALGISEGDKIDEISGTLTNIFPMRQAGKTTVQNGELETEHGKIKITLWGTELPKDLKGNRIKILAINKKFGEIEYKINEYDGKNGHVTEETLNIGNNAEIEEEDDSSKPDKNPTRDDKVTYDRQGFTLLDAAESLAIQHVAVHDMVHAAYAKKNLSPETLQAYVATIWIGLDRAGKIIIGQPIGQASRSSQEACGDIGGADKKCPTGGPKGQESAYNPQNWAEAIVPAGPLKGKMLGEIGKPAILKLEEGRLTKEETGEEPKFPKFADCVKQAAIDLDFNPDSDDDIPY